MTHPVDHRVCEAKASKFPKIEGAAFWTNAWAPVCMRNWLNGRPLFIVCSGPSLNDLDLSLLSRRGIVTLGVNNSWLIHRPNFWVCGDHPARFADVCWKDPGIVKFVPAQFWDARLRVLRHGKPAKRSGFNVSNMPSVLMYRRSNTFDQDTFLTQTVFQWGCMGNTVDSIGIRGMRSVMHVALGLACHLGARRIYLLGADFRMSEERMYAFDEVRYTRSIKHNNVLYAAVDKRCKALAPVLDSRGIRVWNCTEGSGLTAFPYMPYEQAVARESEDCSQSVPSSGWYVWAKKKKG